MVRDYARQRPAQTPQEYLRERPVVGRYAGPYDTIDEIQERLATGVPLNGFEFQRIQRNLHFMRGRLMNVYPENRTDEEEASIAYLAALEEEALRLRPKPVVGRKGGLSPTEFLILKREQKERGSPRGRGQRWQTMTPEERREHMRAAQEENRRRLAA